MPERPNLLLIHLDQWRWDCAGFAGNVDVRTPNLDRLARTATVYDNAWCASSVCVPSRYALISGLYPHQTGTVTNRSTLPGGTMTWPRRLALAGWSTCAIGKMHLNPTYQDVGYQRLQLVEQDGPGQWEDDYHRALDQAGLIDHLDLIDQKGIFRERIPAWFRAGRGAAANTLPDEWHATEWVGAQAERELADWTGGGHCLHVSFVAPHHPFTPPRRWLERYDPRRLSLLPGWSERLEGRELDARPGHYGNDFTEPELRRVMAAYYASIEQIDEVAGRLLGLLEERKLSERTMIVVTSDHGEFLGFHHLLGKLHFPYQPLLRVPLVVRYPGQTEPARDARMANAVDLYPTILAALGLGDEEREPGSPPVVRRPGRDLRGAAPSTHAFSFIGDFNAISDGRRKLVLEPERTTLFDLERDPLERRDVSGDPAYAGNLAELREALLRLRLFTAGGVNHYDAEARLAPRRPLLPQVGELAVRAERRMQAWLADAAPAAYSRVTS